MRVIGITGSIACGKTTVSRELIRRGFPVIDGDLLARSLTGPEGAAMQDIRAAFGDRYISPDGSLNRREMGRLVFSDPQARERLDALMDPYLRSVTLENVEKVRASGASLCFLDMPLLFEKGYNGYCDSVWCVWLPENLQLQRLMARDGYTEEEALNRMRAVMSSDRKADLSSVIIDNSQTVAETFRQVDEQLQKEINRSGSVPRRRRPPGLSPEAELRAYAPVQSVPLPSSGAVRSSSPGSQTPYAAPASAQVPLGIERSQANRKNPSARKADWTLPRWIFVSLICLAVFTAVALTAQLLMNAYLVRQQDLHRSEQASIDRRYPLPKDCRELIMVYSRQYNLSPALIAAVILNESSFDPGAVSSVGARGLMQLMPDTAEWIAHKLNISDYSFEQMDDAATNIRFGCWYLNYLSTLFRGDPLCVVCAYHAGQGEISSWLANPLYSTDGLTLKLDSLPEGPTKIYAGRVTRDYGIYQEKYFRTEDTSGSSGDSASAP